MAKRTFVIGVCECTRRYHRTLPGKSVTIERHDQSQRVRPISYRLRTTAIAERGHQSSIRQKRPDFFLDVHCNDLDGRKRYDVTLCLIQLLPNAPGRGEQVYRSEYYCWDDLPRPPSSLGVVKAIKDLAERLPEKKFVRWRSRQEAQPRG